MPEGKPETSAPGVPGSEVLERLLEDPEMQRMMQEMEPMLHVSKQIIRARIEQNLSRADLAVKAGTTANVISRLENGNMNPSLKLLKKVAEALGKRLHIELQAPGQNENEPHI